jgi:MtN3 and saliva related transmembrane protein
MAIATSEYVGIAAACLTTGSFVPQAIEVLRTRDTRSISLAMYTLFTSGTFLWLCYGICIASPSVLIANAITFILALTILIVKIRQEGP